ncbi:MAG: VTT domain-containing protein, partial [Bdellovibrionota bacterium]
GYLALWTTAYGAFIYVILFAIVFAETGLVVTPFLPGDSLLFAVGSLTAIAGGLDLATSIVVLWAAAVLGDNLNYSVGRYVGQKFFKDGKSRFLNPVHLARTEAFFARHGGRTLVMARFAPILRTYAPFVAGLSRMEYPRFLGFSIFGGLVWIASFTFAGHYFGNIPSVKTNFHYVILAILVLSAMPAIIEIVKARQDRKQGA